MIFKYLLFILPGIILSGCSLLGSKPDSGVSHKTSADTIKSLKTSSETTTNYFNVPMELVWWLLISLILVIVLFVPSPIGAIKRLLWR